MTFAQEFKRDKYGIFVSKRKLNSAYLYLEYIDYLQQHFKADELWYRGVTQEEHLLVPSIYRESIWQYDDKHASWMHAQFIRKAKPFVSNPDSRSSVYWMFVMQHYGLPTRLLDWTEGSLIALYFAVSNLNNIKTPCVYVMDPYWLDEVVRNNKMGLVYGSDQSTLTKTVKKLYTKYNAEIRKKLPKFPLAVEPPYIDERIRAQKSVFTLHGKKKHAFESLSKNTKKPKMVKLRLSNKYAYNIRKDLCMAGITESTIMPDLRGLAIELGHEWEMNLG